MLIFLGKRLLSMIPTFVLASVLVFSFMHMMPGDPAAVMLGDSATPDQVQALRETMGFDQPIYTQFTRWFTGILRGDFGNSIFFHKPVLRIILDRAETSLFIATLSMALIVVVGIPIGMVSAVRYNSLTDQTFSGGAMLAASMPTFWLGLNLMLLFSVMLGWLPSSGFPSVLESGNLGNLKYLVLPCVTLAAPNSALIIRLTRASMLDVLKEGYVTTARSKGLSEFAVTLKHVFRNSLITIISVVGFTFVGLASGTVVTETVFSLPGIGRLVVESVLRRDYPVIQGVILIIAVAYMVVNLLIDCCYTFLDPRIRVG
ncbi:MAG: ABC transporter permease [candidate division NC10 bacterium]|nr:ABC transporter permease [candidate division NC10 bacterium]